MTRAAITVAATRAVALWLLVRGVASSAGFVLVLRAPDVRRGYQAPAPGLVVALTLIPIVLGVLTWRCAPSVAARIFRESAAEDPVQPIDCYRIASAIAGLFLLSQSLPAMAVWLSAWAFSVSAAWSVLGPVRLGAEDRALLLGVEMKAAAVGTIVQAVLGAILLAAPRRIERALTGLRREESNRD
jgi:hypothetical protein